MLYEMNDRIPLKLGENLTQLRKEQELLDAKIMAEHAGEHASWEFECLSHELPEPKVALKKGIPQTDEEWVELLHQYWEEHCQNCAPQYRTFEIAQKCVRAGIDKGLLLKDMGLA